MTRKACGVTVKFEGETSVWAPREVWAPTGEHEQALDAWIQAHLVRQSRWLFIPVTTWPTSISSAHGPWVKRYIVTPRGLCLRWVAFSNVMKEALEGVTLPPGCEVIEGTYVWKLRFAPSARVSLEAPVSLVACESFEDDDDLSHYAPWVPGEVRTLEVA